MHCVVLTRQIGHYHHSRFEAAAKKFESFSVISSAGEGFFSEFAAASTDGYNVRIIAKSREIYKKNVLSGDLKDKVAELLEDLRPDVIALPGWASPEAVAGLQWARRNQIPTILMSESQYDDVSRRTLREMIKSFLVKRCDAALVGGYDARDYMNRLGMRKDKISLGYNAVGNDHFAEGASFARANEQVLRDKNGLPERYFLASGRFIKKKNFELLIKAYAKGLAENTKDFPDLVILGDGEERQNLEQTALDEGVDKKVQFIGFKGYDDLPALYGLSSCFVHVATREQWGLVINEAMASGVPVIASNRCGSTRTLFKGDCSGGIVVDPFSTAEVADALSDLGSRNESDLLELGQQAQKLVSSWGPSRFASGMRDAASKAVANNRKVRSSLIERFLFSYMAKKVITDVD